MVAAAGILGEVAWPEGVRVDTWVETGATVTPYYDSLLAKLMVYAPTRKEAIAKLVDALNSAKVHTLSTIASPLDPLSRSCGRLSSLMPPACLP